MAYVDGFVAPVQREERQAYADTARAASPVFVENDALRMIVGGFEVFLDSKAQ